MKNFVKPSVLRPEVPHFRNAKMEKFRETAYLLGYALVFEYYSAELSAEYSAKCVRIFGIGRYQFFPYRSYTNIY